MLHPHRAAAVVAVLFATVLLPGSIPASAADGGPPIITLYGNAALGWGFNSTTITSPGPTLTVLLGYPVTLHLNGTDAPAPHNWFIDYNNNNQTDVGEPKAQDFTGPGPRIFTFTPDQAGTFFYKCAYHSNRMFGLIRVVPQTNITLHGNLLRGWGFSNSTISSPGPSLAFLSGTNVTFTLIANETDQNLTHDFYIDYNGDRAPNPNEPKAPNFSGGKPETVTLHLDQAGNFTYYCEYHPGIMYGTVLIYGESTASGGFNVALIPGIMLAALSGVLIFAAVYHVRAVRAAKRAK